MPSTGARRPGPANVALERVRTDVVAPVGLAIEAAGIDAGIESLRVVDGAMQDPTGPWVVAWYENLGSLGTAGNVVMAGHIDYWNVGPAVFYNLSTLEAGDEIVVTGDDGKTYPFAVEWVRQYDSASIPLDEVAGPTEEQSLTLITCGGAFDYANGHYLQRTVVRANRAGSGPPLPPEPPHGCDRGRSFALERTAYPVSSRGTRDLVVVPRVHRITRLPPSSD